MCCSSQRSSIRPLPERLTRSPAPQAATPQASAAPPATASLGGLAALHYLQAAPIRVAGPATRRVYTFSGARPLQMVDARDALILGLASIFRID